MPASWRELIQISRDTPQQAQADAALRQFETKPAVYLAHAKLLARRELTSSNRILMASAFTKLVASRISPLPATDRQALRDEVGRLAQAATEPEVKTALSALDRAVEAMPVAAQ